MSRLNRRSLHKAQPITLLALALGIIGVVLVIAGMVSGILGPGSPEPAGAGEAAAIALVLPPRPSEKAPDPARDLETPRPDAQGRASAWPEPEPVEKEIPTALVSSPAESAPEHAAEDLVGPAQEPGASPPPPADAESAPLTVAPTPPSGPVRPPHPAPSPAGIDSPEMGGLRSSGWILSQDAEAYTIQLLAVRKLEGLRALLRGLRLDLELAYFVSHRKGRDWYVLIAGVFPSRQAALAASKGLPRSLRGGPPWIRRMAGVQHAIKPASG